MSASAVRQAMEQQLAELTTVRASSAPKAMICPGSIRLPELLVSLEHEAAGLGTAAHDGWAQIVDGDAYPDAQLLAARHGVDADQLGVLLRFAYGCWSDVKAEFPSPQCEVELVANLTPKVALTGHIDTLSLIPRTRRFRLADLKTGRLDASYLDQLMAYAWLLFANDPTLVEGDACVIWLRDSQIERYHVTRAQAEAWRKKFVERVVTWDGAFHPGEHCGFCPRSYEPCRAMVAMAQRDLAILSGDEFAAQLANGLRDLSGPEIVQIRRRAKTIEKVLESLDSATRAAVRERGPLDSGDGQVLKFIEVEGREIDTLAAWPILQSRLTDEEIAERVTVSISQVEKLVAQRAGRGKGAGAVKQLASELDAAGAVSIKRSDQLRLVRK